MSNTTRLCIYLECTQGTSNKGYEISVTGSDADCALTTRHGPIGRLGSDGVHFAGTWAAMERKAWALVKQKQAKGYTIVDQQGDSRPPAPKQAKPKLDMDAAPPLMEPDVTASPDQRDAMLDDRVSIMQVLVPGQRCGLRLGPGAAHLSDANGATLPLPRVLRGHLPHAFAHLPTATLDCILGPDKVLVVYDVFTIDNVSVRDQGFATRLQRLIGGVQGTANVRIAHAYTIPGGKRAAAAAAAQGSQLVFTQHDTGTAPRVTTDLPTEKAQRPALEMCM